jgi:hypothetical protein
VKLLSKASVKEALNGPSTQLIETTSCVERSYATIGAEEFSGQTLLKLLITKEASQKVDAHERP